VLLAFARTATCYKPIGVWATISGTGDSGMLKQRGLHKRQANGQGTQVTVVPAVKFKQVYLFRM